jgi:hypothetical protein
MMNLKRDWMKLISYYVENEKFLNQTKFVKFDLKLELNGI